MTNDDRFFLRFRWHDASDLALEIEAARTKLQRARQVDDKSAVLESLNRLGFCLTPADQEAEAVGHLEEALALARKLGDASAEIGVLLNLATARQYLGEHEVAQVLFHEALRRGIETGISEHDHFVLHHQGRCYAEQGDIAAARLCFERALALRKQLGVPMARTELALALLKQ